MASKILISGNRSTFTTLAFDPEEQKLEVLANYEAPFNASWVEPTASCGGSDQFIGLSEEDDVGLLYTFEIDHLQKTCKITSQQHTMGAPAHFSTLRDGSAVALATYYGGSVALYPITRPENVGFQLADNPHSEVFPEFAYKAKEHGPVAHRQRQSHVHQVLEDKKGLLYAPDLGSDRVWTYQRNGLKMDLCGWLQCPAGHGPRHAVLTPDEKMMYVVGELSHTVVAFDMTASPAKSIPPIKGFAPNVIPPSIHKNHQTMMDSSEICLHPEIPNVVYVSNRWARHIAAREPFLTDVPAERPQGDDVTIILLSEDGKKVQDIRHVSTQLDVIRGMRLSNDGNHVVVCGQEGGGVEVYRISGHRGDSWTLVARLSEGLDSGIKHAVWL